MKYQISQRILRLLIYHKDKIMNLLIIIFIWSLIGWIILNNTNLTNKQDNWKNWIITFLVSPALFFVILSVIWWISFEDWINSTNEKITPL